MPFEYFYTEQSEQFTFYRIPKVLFTDEQFQPLSTEAKLLYGLLLDRVSLSRENGWIDEKDRVYIIFTNEALQNALRCSEKSITKYMGELTSLGLIERIRQGLGKPSLIYVKNFINSKTVPVRNRKICGSEAETISSQEPQFLQGNNTEKNKTEYTHTNPILPDTEDRIRYDAYIQEQIGIRYLKQDSPGDAELLDGIASLILEVLCSKRTTIRIAKEDLPVSVVKSRFMKLNIGHIRYVMECLNSNTTKVRSIKQYMLAVLYNAPTTMNSNYQAEVNHDMAVGKI